jgi:mannose-6-phosphate isomerase-like protein (cupin superfamily)
VERSSSPDTPFRLFRGPALVRQAEATRFLWGDEESGQVSDLIYGRGEQISAVIFTLGPGHWFGASSDWKPLYDQHRFYYVVQGTLAIHDPETGDVAVVTRGEAITWRGPRYHFGYNVGDDEVVVLDWFAPPERGPEVPETALAGAKREIGEIRGGRDDLLGAWPDRRPEELTRALTHGGLTTVRRSEALHVIHGSKRPMLVSILASSTDLTAGTFSLGENQKSEPEQHPGDEVVFTLSGRLHVRVCDSGEWFELNPLDCVFLPAGTTHEYWSYGAERCTAVFCVAPGYR